MKKAKGMTFDQFMRHIRAMMRCAYCDREKPSAESPCKTCGAPESREKPTP